MMYRTPLLAALALLLVASPAVAQTVRVEIMRAEVKCVTVTRNGALETTCSIKGLQRINPKEVTAPARKFEMPGGDFKIPPPLTEADLTPSGELPGEEPAAPASRGPSCAPTEEEPEDPTPDSDHDLHDGATPPAKPTPRQRPSRIAPPKLKLPPVLTRKPAAPPAATRPAPPVATPPAPQPGERRVRL